MIPSKQLRHDDMGGAQQNANSRNDGEEGENNKAQSINDHCCKFPITCYVMIFIFFS